MHPSRVLSDPIKVKIVHNQEPVDNVYFVNFLPGGNATSMGAYGENWIPINFGKLSGKKQVLNPYVDRLSITPRAIPDGRLL